ncbi:MAG: RrF2 family transcriptional regulator [Promethearchaeota archaeon]
MKIFPEKIFYGISAVFELAKNNNKKLVQIREISESQNIPHNYLEKLLLDLKKAGIVESIRGSQGGYKLQKSPNEIKVLDVIIALEGNIQVSRNTESANVMNFYWKGIEKKIEKLFYVTFEDLLIQEMNLKEKMFFQI